MQAPEGAEFEYRIVLLSEHLMQSFRRAGQPGGSCGSEGWSLPPSHPGLPPVARLHFVLARSRRSSERRQKGKRRKKRRSFRSGAAGELEASAPNEPFVSVQLKFDQVVGTEF